MNFSALKKTYEYFHFEFVQLEPIHFICKTECSRIDLFLINYLVWCIAMGVYSIGSPPKRHQQYCTHEIYSWTPEDIYSISMCYFPSTYRRFPKIVQKLCKGHTTFHENYRRLTKTFEEDPKMFPSYANKFRRQKWFKKWVTYDITHGILIHVGYLSIIVFIDLLPMAYHLILYQLKKKYDQSLQLKA